MAIPARTRSAGVTVADQGRTEMLGHSDIRVTRGYTHVASPLTQDAANRLGKTPVRNCNPE
jgi:hypothetical protein